MADFDLMGGLGDLGAGFLGGVGSIIGDFASEEDRERARQYLEMARRQYEGIDPTIRAATEEVVDLGPTAYDALGRELDPETRDAQVRAYRAMMERGLSGGMDAQSRAALSEAMTEAAQQESGARQALQQRFASRGRGGSMAELASQLANTQASAEGSNRAATRAAGDASARAYQALAQGAGLAGQVRGQDYGQASDRASARDIVARHNAANRQSVYGRTADRQQRAQEATVGNQFRRAEGVAGGYRDQAGESWREEERKKRLGYGVGSTVGRGAGVVAGGFL